MSLVVAWVAFPIVLAALSLGCGLLVELVAGVRLPTGTLLAAGFALLVVAGQLATLTGTTASLAAPGVVVLAVLGVGLSLRTGRRPDPWGVVAACGAYAAYALPVAASGRATFAGYIKLDDTSTYLAMLERLLTHGHSLAGLAPSTYEATLSTSLAYGYPVGSLVPLGIGHELVREDPAWLWQPYLASLGALLALGLYGLAGRLIAPRPLRAFAAFVAAQPALLYGYALWGGIKELATAALLPALATFGLLVARSETVRAVVPLAAASAALVGILSVGGAVWLAPGLLGAAGLAARSRGPAFALKLAAAFAVAAVVLATPSIADAVHWLPRSGAFTSATELGNLVGPLRWIQVFGVWPVGDFRRTPADADPAYALVAVTAGAAAAGLGWAWARRRLELLAYAGAIAVGAAVFVVAGSPWIGGKALAVASPVPVLLGLVACAALLAHGRRVEAAVLAAAVVGGVAWSNVLAYREVWLAPRSRLAELESIGTRHAGAGPTLMTEFEPYGARHFLRDLDPEGASELRRRIIPLRSRLPLEPQAYADIDRFDLRDLLVYRTLVLRRSPVESRPPSAYRRVERGRWYEVWQRRAAAPTILEHLPLGTPLDPAAVPSCAQVLRLARLSGVRLLATVPRKPVAVVSLAAGAPPTGWTAGYALGSVDPRASGEITTRVRTAGSGRYEAWVGGSFVGRLVASIDGRRVGASRHQLEWSGQFVDLGGTSLGPGLHEVTLRYELGGPRPGSYGLAPFPLGPLAVAPADPRLVVKVAPSQARSLCGRRLDWVEAIG